MRFFDFFDEGAEEPKLPPYREKRKGKPGEPTVNLPGGLQGPLPSSPSDKLFPALTEESTVEIPSDLIGGDKGFAPKYPVTPERSAQLQGRNAIDMELRSEALKIIKDASQSKMGLKEGEQLAFGGIDFDEVSRSIYGAHPGMYANVLRATLRQIGVADPAFPAKFEPVLRAFEDKESQLLRQQEQIPQVAIAPTPEKLAHLNEQVQKAEEDLKYAVSNEQRARLQQTITHGKAMLARGQTEAEKPDTTVYDLQGDPIEKPIVDAIENAGVPEDEFNRAIIDMGKTLGVDLVRKVDMSIALMRLLNRPEFAETRPDFEAIGAAATAPAPQVGATAGKSEAGGEASGQPAQPSMPSLEAQAMETMVKLAATRQYSWYEVITFALLSMILKPQVAALIFSREAERGQLDAQLAMTMRHIKRLEAADKRGHEVDMLNRKQAAEQKQYERERRDKRQDFEKGFIKDWLLLNERASLFNKKADDETEKKLQDDLKTRVSMAGRAAQAFDQDGYKKQMGYAEAIMERLRVYREEKYGAEVTGP